ncbi:MAG TPA: prenyltransferase/squalene oxidase repeat-containing protein [Pirellulales bacterium]|nr:prenyltransferase/squalene oxidase repeat-containing protein [Pirellulales bacterium]
MPSLRRRLLVSLLSLSAGLSVAQSRAAAADVAKGDGDRAREQAVIKAIDYLRQKGQAEDGSFSRQAGPAVTALVTTGLLHSGLAVKDPMVAKALKYIEGFVHDDGGIYKEGSTHQNYETCVAILVLKEANRDGQYDKVLKKAESFIKGLQWDEQEGQDEASLSYGGAGYGSKKRPDLSNTGFFIDALKATGNGPDDEAMKKALLFVSRCQNLETEHNTSPFAAKNPDGGFYYTVVGDGESFAGKLDNGGLRSYGSMTYAGLKSMIFAGVGPDDPRVKAAVEWAHKHYTLDSNPGMGEAGLYYYYHTFAKALHALGETEFSDSDGTKHDWRRELAAELVNRQHADGSWSNSTPRWLESDPNLVTGYALLTLSYCRPNQAADK